MANTRPPQPATGPVTQGCYAAELRDCDRGPPTREHYISENLLERFGNSFTIEGTPWAASPKKVGPGALTARIVCERHNNALSSIDTTIGVLYDALLGALHGRHVGELDFDGEGLERWAMKLMFGISASGNVTYPGIGKVVSPSIPLEYLRVLFGEDEFPGGLRVQVRARRHRACRPNGALVPHQTTSPKAIRRHSESRSRSSAASSTSPASSPR